MCKINKSKLLTVFCFTSAIIFLGVFVFQNEAQNNVFEYEEVSAQLHYIYTEIVPPIYDMVHDFHNGYAIVIMGNVWNDEREYWESSFYGLIDKTGTLVLPLIYDRIESVVITNNIVFVNAVYDGNFGIINLHGDEILPFIYSRISIRYDVAVLSYGEGDDRAAGLFCLTSKEFIVPIGIYFAINTLYSEGRTWVTLGPANAWRWGVIDINNGELLTPMVYVSRAGNGIFRNGLVRAHRDDGNGIRSGFLDIDGNEITEFIYDDASGFWNIFAGASYNGRWGLIDTEGNYIIAPMFDSMSGLQQYAWCSDFRYFPVSLNGQWGVWDMIRSELAIPHIYGGIIDIYDNFAIVHYGNWNDLSGVLNIETAEYVVPLGYMRFYNILGNGLALVSKGTRGNDYKMGVIDIRTGNIIADFIYSDINWRIDENDVIKFLSDAEWELLNWDGEEWYGLSGGRWGLMDLYGNEIVPALYGGIQHFIAGLFIVEPHSLNMGIINIRGEIVLPLEYTYIGSFWHPRGFDIVLTPVNKGGQWVWGRKDDSYDGYGYTLTGGKWGFIDTSGNLVVPVELDYDFVNPVVDGMAAVMRDGRWGFIAVR